MKEAFLVAITSLCLASPAVGGQGCTFRRSPCRGLRRGWQQGPTLGREVLCWGSRARCHPVASLWGCIHSSKQPKREPFLEPGWLLAPLCLPVFLFWTDARSWGRQLAERIPSCSICAAAGWDGRGTSSAERQMWPCRWWLCSCWWLLVLHVAVGQASTSQPHLTPLQGWDLATPTTADALPTWGAAGVPAGAAHPGAPGRREGKGPP